MSKVEFLSQFSTHIIYKLVYTSTINICVYTATESDKSDDVDKDCVDIIGPLPPTSSIRMPSIKTHSSESRGQEKQPVRCLLRVYLHVAR